MVIQLKSIAYAAMAVLGMGLAPWSAAQAQPNVTVSEAFAGTGNFSFTTTGGLDPATFTLNSSGSQGFTGVPAGTYSVTQQPLAGTVLNEMLCQPGIVDVATATWTFTLDATKTEASCAFINGVEPGTLAIEKQVIGPNPGNWTFAYNVDGPTTAAPYVKTTGAGTYHTSAALAPGNYTISEIGNPIIGNGTGIPFTLESIVCDGAATNAFAIASGQTVTCTFVNKQSSQFTLMVHALGNTHATFSFTSNVPDFASFDVTTKSVQNVGVQTLGLAAPGPYEITWTGVTWAEKRSAWEIYGIEGGNCSLSGKTISVEFTPGMVPSCTLAMAGLLLGETAPAQ